MYQKNIKTGAMAQLCLILGLTFWTMTSSAQSWTPGTGLLYTNPSTTKVGIGITPSELFHVNGGALKIGNGTDATSRSVNMIKIGYGNYIQIGEWEADDMLSFKASKYNFTNGNVGIGKTNPVRTLDVNGDIALPLGGSILWGHTFNPGNNRLAILHTGIHGYIDYKDNLHFRTDGQTSALTLYGNGGVGIGFVPTYNAGHYKNMGYKLAVNGNIICEEVKVIADVPDAD